MAHKSQKKNWNIGIQLSKNSTFYQQADISHFIINHNDTSRYLQPTISWKVEIDLPLVDNASSRTPDYDNMRTIHPPTSLPNLSSWTNLITKL